MNENVPVRKYAGVWIRSIASFIDDVIVMVASMMLTYGGLFLVYLITRPTPRFGEAFTGGFIQSVNVAAMICFSLPYYIGFHWKFGWTPGKKILGIRVVRSEGSIESLSFWRSAARYFAQILSALPLGAGYFMAALNERKRALHEVISGTVSVMEEGTKP